MQKVYLLLRSNKQTGPYSIEELLQLNLKPFDLVWVEGRSAAWQYPSEIPSLKPYVPETPHADVPFKPIATEAMEEKLSDPQIINPQKPEIAKRVFVSVPKTYVATNEEKTYQQHKAFMPLAEDSSYERKEEIRPVPAASQPVSLHTQQKPVEDETVHTSYSRSLNDVEEEYTNWVYKQKTKKKASVNPKDFALAVLILGVIGGGYYVMSRPSVANSILPANKTATQISQQPNPNGSQETEPKEILSPEQRMVSNPGEVAGNDKPIDLSKNIKTKNPPTVSKSQTNSSVPQVQNSMPVEKTNPNIHDDNTVVPTKEGDVKQQPKENAPVEKKKKFGDVLKNIFSKKEKKEEVKNDEVVLEEPKPATNRQATKREADDNSSVEKSNSNEINTADLMEQVDLSSNAPENWMMGVKNLKITLRNRSNVTLQTASVLVNYYDENNQLLEKKLVYFNNVAPKAKATVAAPDHKFADHVDFKLTTVSAKEDRYARY